MPAPSELLSTLLSATEAERAEAAELLLASLDPGDGRDADAWRTELDRRLASLDAGSARTVAWDEVRQRVFGAKPGP